ncbi:proline and serine-rich protein 2 isoform X2 [Choloepus didactylus]|uniref:proline and serine-rich protein 2 isoform X2 n=1 Tax=Choloepus didactylus TaxID=27675 RepID=UPI00189F7721|nr:proline and serine-rich protein 2 isoform X2 [Choloepus didactylus]
MTSAFFRDDESLKYLTHEEKDVILFFEETIDSLEDDFDDFEEQALCDSGVHCHSPRSLGDSTSSHSELEDIIDLVQLAPVAGDPECPLGAGRVGKDDTPVLECAKQDAEKPPPPDSTAPELLPAPSQPVTTTPAPPRKELLPPSPPAEHPKLPRSVPTPLVIAQQISEKLAGSEALSPTSPSKEGRSGEWRTLAALAPRNGDPFLWHRHAAQPAPKVHRFPSNISVTNSAGREFNKTISRAAVNVQERKAQVLANISGISFLPTGDMGDLSQRSDGAELQRSFFPEQVPCGQGKPSPSREGRQQSRGVQTEQPLALANGFQSIHDVLMSEPSPFVSAGKTITFRPDPAISSSLTRQQATGSLCETWQPARGQDAGKRSGSLPRAGGFRPQGITVQFSGRGSTEEARREALRKLGLLKENL